MKETSEEMKGTPQKLKKDILDLNKTLASMIQDIRQQGEFTDGRFNDWEKTCRDITHQISEEVIRIAIIGPVKSGKSTLINSLFSADYLKRGAGILTSIVTRIRGGNSLKARLYFKSWDEVNADIEQSLIMLPTIERTSDDRTFDIRRQEDRKKLSVALGRLSDDLLITDGVRNMNTVLLSLYLKGYDRTRDIISSNSNTAEFFNSRFSEHQEFVGNDELAVYLKDVELEINSDTIDHSIEIADCQGSDSPNPLHLAMIQDYLLKTHFIVYVVSSRIGLRQADIRFLSIIKKMGILDNILFVVNVDFSEHESVDDLNSVVNKVREELSVLRPDPEIYCFSALFNLFSSSDVNLTKRDSMRLAHWIEEKDLVSLSNNDYQRFKSVLNEKLTRERFSIFLWNNLERMNVITAGIINWVSMNRDLIEKDKSSTSGVVTRINQHQQRIHQMRSLIKNTLSGATDKIMKELKSDIDRFFNVQSNGMINQTLDFVSNYNVSIEKYRPKLNTSGFSNTLYVIFQDFKRTLDLFITENIDPEIARYVREIEERIETELNAVARPYYSIATDDMLELKQSIGEIAGDINVGTQKRHMVFDIDSVKQMSSLTLPSSSTALRYSPKVRTEAMMRLGLYSLTGMFKKFLKKTSHAEKEEQMKALADGLVIIKNETEEAVFFHFENYRENFKFQYVARLLSASEEYIYKMLIERYQTYTTDVKAIERIIEKEGKEKDNLISYLEKISDNASKLQNEIELLKRQIGSS